MSMIEAIKTKINNQEVPAFDQVWALSRIVRWVLMG